MGDKLAFRRSRN